MTVPTSNQGPNKSSHTGAEPIYKSNQIIALLKNAIVKLEIEKTATPR